MHDAVSLERLGIPTAVLVTQQFRTEAALQRDALGMVDLVPALITHPLSTLTDEQIGARADEALGQITTIWRGSSQAT